MTRKIVALIVAGVVGAVIGIVIGVGPAAADEPCSTSSGCKAAEDAGGRFVVLFILGFVAVGVWLFVRARRKGLL